MLVPTAEVQCDLGPLEPLLNRALRLHVGDVGLERLLLDAERLKDAQHLLHRIVDLADLMPLDRSVSSDMLSLLNAAHLLHLGLLALLHHTLGHDELLEHLLLRVLAPPQPSLSQIAVLEGEEELFSRIDSPIVKVLLSGSRSDPLEDLFTKGLSGDRTDSHHSVLFFANVADPFKENILELGHVDVARLSSLEGPEGRLEVLFDLVSVLCCHVQGLSQGLNLSCLLPAGLVTCMHQVTPLINLILEFCIQLALNRIVMLLGPGTERFLQPVLLPVDEHLLHRALLLVRLPRVLQPGVEAASDLHLCHSAHVVSHDFLRQILRFGNDGQAT